MFIASKPSILIVDDDKSILNIFTKIFQRKGYFVTVAEKGQEAIEKIGLGDYDIAFIDLSLPDMEGDTLFPLIKNSSPKTLKIMLTGKTWLQTSIEGADVFLEKPINLEKLLSISNTRLKNREI